MPIPTAFAKRLATIAQDQHTQFQFTNEADPLLCRQIRKWTEDIGFRFSSCTTVPWSAVFISWCVKKAGATPAEFKFAMAHWYSSTTQLRTSRNPEPYFRASKSRHTHCRRRYHPAQSRWQQIQLRFRQNSFKLYVPFGHRH